MSPSNSASQMAHKSCVARHSCNILICWPYLTWPWPWLLLSIRPILIYCLLYPLGSFSAKFGLAAVVSPVSGADKAKSNAFGIWPDLDLTSDFLRKKNFLKSTRRESSIAPSPASLRPSALELGKWEQNLPPPTPTPTPAGRVPQRGAG